MRKIGKRMMASVLTAAMTVGLFGVQGIGSASDLVEAAEIPVRETTVTEAPSGQIIVGVEGVDTTSAQKDIIDLINEVRLDACTSGNVPNPNDPDVMLTADDYYPIQLGVNCQKAAVIRAAEGSVMMAHKRPDGTMCSTVASFFGVNCAENLAWSYKVGTAMDGWIGEKSYWVDDLDSASAGHYLSMINPNYRYVGIATFNPKYDNAPYDWACTSGEFETSDTAVASSDYEEAKNDTVIQKMPILVSSVQEMAIRGDSVLSVGADTEAELLVNFFYKGTVGSNTVTDCPVYSGVSWSSSEPDVLSVDADGKVTAKAEGQAVLTASIGSGSGEMTVEKTVIVVPEGVTVTGAENPDMVYTKSGVRPPLSKTAVLTLSNGSTVPADVSWEEITASQYSPYLNGKEFEVAGMVMGFDVVQKVHVYAATVTKAYTETDTLETDSGTTPDTVSVKINLSTNMTMKLGTAPWTGIHNMSYEGAKIVLDWDTDSLEQYKLREGGDFTINGTVTVTTIDGEQTIDLAQKMHVNPATVTKVEFMQDEVTTDSGTVPDYPKASVTWSNGDETEEEIQWADAEPTKTDRKYMERSGGDYTLTGTYQGETTTITVHVNPAVALEAEIPAEEKNKTVPSGTPAELTKTATVTWSNGDTTTETISWEEQSHDDYGKITGGNYTVKGTVEGLTVSVKVTVLHATIRSVEELKTIETVQKKAPILPETVRVNWSNEDETDEPISWEEIPASAYATPDEDFVVTGTITDFDDKKTEVTVVVHVNEKALTGIAWKDEGPDTDTSYYSYQKQDLTGTLIATYDNDETAEVILTPDMITAFDADSRKSTQVVTITYTEAGVSKTLDVTMHLIQRTGIRIVTEPEKTAYIEDETLDLTGLSMVELLDNDTERSISEDELKNVVCTGYDLSPSEYGSQKVTVSLVEFSDTFDITVRKKQLNALRIVSLPKQVTYVTTQPLNMSGLSVKAGYDNGSEKTIKITQDMLREDLELTEENVRAGNFGLDANTDTAGTHKLYILYSEKVVEEDGRTATQYAAAYFDITVLEKVVQSVEFAKAPGQTEYPEDDIQFDNFSDAMLLVHNNNDYDEQISIREAEITGFDIGSVGTYEVTVTYGGKSLTFDAVVRAKQITGIYVIPPTRVSYTEEEYLDLTGGEVVIVYDNGREDRIALSEENENLEIAFDDESDPCAPLTEAKRKLLVFWKGEEVLTEDGGQIGIDTIHKILQKIEWKAGSPASNTSYYAYDKADLTGTLLASYDNGDVEEVALTPDMITTFDAESQNRTQTVTISYSYAGVRVTMNTEMKLVKRAGIRISSVPAKTEYIEGETLDVTGLQIDELLDNDEVRALSEEEAATAVCTGFISRPSAYGDQKITVRVGSFSDTFSVSVRKKKLAGLHLISAPTLCTYAETQPLSLAGLKVEAIYDNGDRKDLSVTKDMVREGVTKEGLGSGDTGKEATTVGVGTHTLSVLYIEDKMAGWVDFDVEVIEKVVESLEFDKGPSKTEYPEGDVNFDLFGGIRIIAHCNNDFDEQVEVTSGMISGFDLNKVGTQTVTVTYGGQKLTFTAKIREKKATQTVVTPPSKTEYEPGEQLDLTGAKIVITYDNGTTEEIPVSEDNKDIRVTFVGGSDAGGSLSEGERKLVITYKGETLEMADGTPVTINVEQKKVKTKFRNEWRKNVWYDKDGYATDLTMKWRHNKKGWWIVDSEGKYRMKKWQKIDGKWYFFRADGYMASKEWCQGYWVNRDGTCTYAGKARWRHNSKGWWYEDNKGWYAKRCWQKIDGKWYYFGADGYMVTSRYVDGYWIGADGVCR
ncbi:MAG: bacterial Ig-like domain-containing protein [Eubacterium sp.]|nr:bacterial Ig-like domain-containing protein [Eubacterium sp.]